MTSEQLAIMCPAGTFIRSVEEWFEKAPPQGGAAHWRDGRSAKELARAWFRSGVAAAPQELLNLLLSRDVTRDSRITIALPERVTTFDGCGSGRRHDLVVVLRGANNETWVAGVEAKAGEPLDTLVIDKHEHGRNLRDKGQATNLPERIDDLVLALFGRSLGEDVRLGQLRYQLLTAAAGTLVEAANRQAAAGLLIVHDLAAAMGDTISPTQLAVSDFLAALSREQGLFTTPGVVFGPYTVPGGGRIPTSVPLYVALIRPVS